MKLIWFYVLGAAIFFIALEARSDDKHHHVSQDIESKGTALAIAASQIHMDWSTTKLQGGAGIGSHKGAQAISIGLGKKTGKVLINGSVSTTGTDTAFGAGINFRF